LWLVNSRRPIGSVRMPAIIIAGANYFELKRHGRIVASAQL
jgi:hypothetical protein